jgi:hypothetical protein
MIRIRIQLPDDLYAEAKQLCEEREMSFSELARRGIEHLMNALNAGKKSEAWLPPKPRRLGWSGPSDEEWKRLAQEGNTEGEL